MKKPLYISLVIYMFFIMWTCGVYQTPYSKTYLTISILSFVLASVSLTYYISKSKTKNIVKKITQIICYTPITISLGIINLLIFIKLSSEFYFDNILITILFALIFFVPSLYYFLISLNIFKTKNKKKIIISILLTFIFIIYYFVFSLVYVLTLVTHPVTNINSYDKIIKQDVFPKIIPKSAKNPKFYYSPGFLQGGQITVLYYKDSKKNIDNYTNKLNSKAKWIGTYNDKYQNSNFSLNNLKNRANFIDITNNDVIIYIIKEQCDATSWCNHGEYKAVLINHTTNEIMFSSEIW